MNITSPESEWPSLNSKGWSSVQSLSRARLCDSNISVLYNSNANHAKLSFLVQLLSHVQLFGTPWTAACEASLSITNSQNSLKFMSIESVMPSSHLILCCPIFLLPPIPPSIRVFSNESILHMRGPKYWTLSFSISPSNEYSWLSPLRLTG